MAQVVTHLLGFSVLLPTSWYDRLFQAGALLLFKLSVMMLKKPLPDFVGVGVKIYIKSTTLTISKCTVQWH